MFPTLINLGPIHLSTYPVFIGIAFFVGLFVVWKRGRELHYEEKELFDVVFTALFWLFIGARIGYILLHANELINNPQWVSLILRPAWFLPAGLLAAAWSVSHESKKYRWDMYQVLDILVTGLVLAQAILALGSFVAGFGYGIATNSFVGVRFANLFDKRYPIQLWEFFGFGLSFIYLWWVEGVYRTFPWYRGNRSQAATGFLTAMYVIWWGIISTIATLFRAPDLRLGWFRFDIVTPMVFGIIGGLMLLGYRSAGSWRGLWVNILEYFGLTKKQHYRRQRTELQKLFE